MKKRGMRHKQAHSLVPTETEPVADGTAPIEPRPDETGYTDGGHEFRRGQLGICDRSAKQWKLTLSTLQ